MSVEMEYSIVDVFTRNALAGNPLAVVVDAVGLTTEAMQSVAREFNLSETTFIQRRDPARERTEGVRVRIFTTQEELPFAGHPTLGTASVLKTLAPEVIVDNQLKLALNVGSVPVRFEPGSDNSTTGIFGEMTQRDPEFGVEFDPAEVARLTGLRIDDLDPSCPPQAVSTGTAFAIVVLRSVDALARLNVNHRESTPWLRERGARWFYIVAPTGTQDPAFRARMQFYGGEDPATGSAAGCAISHLVARGLVESGRRILLQQGVEIGRLSELFLSAKTNKAKISDVCVAGSTVLVAKGHLFLP
ncbi:MAG TPA: PhzF family phenazine biosynthesis protein [Terracidiphilus sp.]|nr:PhzF family phenazine biosynthesis protein [Terracidiphilus sp.]